VNSESCGGAVGATQAHARASHSRVPFVGMTIDHGIRPPYDALAMTTIGSFPKSEDPSFRCGDRQLVELGRVGEAIQLAWRSLTTQGKQLASSDLIQLGNWVDARENRKWAQRAVWSRHLQAGIRGGVERPDSSLSSISFYPWNHPISQLASETERKLFSIQQLRIEPELDWQPKATQLDPTCHIAGAPRSLGPVLAGRRSTSLEFCRETATAAPRTASVLSRRRELGYDRCRRSAGRATYLFVRRYGGRRAEKESGKEVSVFQVGIVHVHHRVFRGKMRGSARRVGPSIPSASLPLAALHRAS
jgi:hypothetical protein